MFHDAIRLFHNRFPSSLPGVETAIKVVDRLKAQLLENGKGIRASSTCRAMNQKTLAPVQSCDLLLKSVFQEIDVLRSGDVTFRVFAGRPDIEDGHFPGLDQFFRGLGVHMGDFALLVLLCEGNSAEAGRRDDQKCSNFHEPTITPPNSLRQVLEPNACFQSGTASRSAWRAR